MTKQDSSAQEKGIKQVIVEAISELQMTGMSDSEGFQAFYPFTKVPHVLPIPAKSSRTQQNNTWVSMLQDTHIMSTFAVVSNRCLVAPRNEHILDTSYGRCLGAEEKAYRVRTVLETTLMQVSGPVQNSGQQEIPEHGGLYLGFGGDESYGNIFGAFERVKNNRHILEFRKLLLPRVRESFTRLTHRGTLLKEYIDQDTETRVQSSVLVVTQ